MDNEREAKMYWKGDITFSRLVLVLGVLDWGLEE